MMATTPTRRTWRLLGADGRPYDSDQPGTLGGHRRSRIYGRLDCPAARRALAQGGYRADRVFFADEATARAAGYRPCAVCLPEQYRQWKTIGRPHISGPRDVDRGMKARPFEKLIEEHGPVVMRVVRALLGPADADDAWSETFLAALEAYPRLRPDSNIRGWLVTIAHHKAIDQSRARARRPQPAAELPERTAADHGIADRDPDLWGALEGLPFKQRAAVAYHHLAGMPYAEVAALIDSSEAAARRAAADGLAKLRQTYRTGAAS